MKNIFIAVPIVLLYIVCTLGSLSPVFCRGGVAFVGGVSNLLSISSGFGLLFYVG